MGYCNYCGKENPENSKYCNSCGKEIIKAKQTIETETPIETEAYTVTLYSLGNLPLKVVEALSKWFNCSLDEAVIKANNLPIVLTDNCDKKTALSNVKEWQRLGAGVKYTKKGEVDKPKISFNVLPKINNPQLIKIISTLLFTIGLALFLFLPLFFNNVTIGEQTTKKTYSLFNYASSLIGLLLGKSFNISYFSGSTIGIMVPIFITALWGDCVLKAVMALVNDIKCLISGKYIVSIIKIVGKLGLLPIISFIVYMLAMLIIVGFDGAFIFNAILVAVILLTATILEKIALKNETL